MLIFLFNYVRTIDFNHIKITGPFGDFCVLMAQATKARPNAKKTAHDDIKTINFPI